MANLQSAHRGSLLGLAVGDAMGYTVDSRSWQEITEDFGPNGLLGYDLANGYADVTSYTQLAAFTCNGLLLGMTRGQMTGRMAPFVKYIGLSSREWAASQRPYGRPEKSFCWLLHQGDICRRHCMDTRMLDTLSRENLGTPEEPKNVFAGPGSLTAALGVGLFFDREGLEQREVDRLGAEAVALTHGSPTAFLSGAALTHIISRMLWNPKLPLKKAVLEAAEAVKAAEAVEAAEIVETVEAAEAVEAAEIVEIVEVAEAVETVEVVEAEKAVEAEETKRQLEL